MMVNADRHCSENRHVSGKRRQALRQAVQVDPGTGRQPHPQKAAPLLGNIDI